MRPVSLRLAKKRLALRALARASKAKPARPEWQIVHGVADSYLTRYERVILKSVEKAQEAFDEAEVRKAIESGAESMVQAAMGPAYVTFATWATRYLSPLTLEVVNASGSAVSRTGSDIRSLAGASAHRVKIRALKFGLTFDTTDPKAATWAGMHSSSFVTGVNDETRLAIRQIIQKSFVERWTVDKTAVQLRSVIGLTTKQAGALSSFQARLSDPKNFGKLVYAGGKKYRIPAGGFSQEQIDSKVAAYSKKLLNDRARLIARTETITAANRGQQQWWLQAYKGGRIPKGVKRRWIVTPDDKLCPICLALKGKLAELDGDFESEGEKISGPSRHPGCRCGQGLDYSQVETVVAPTVTAPAPPSSVAIPKPTVVAPVVAPPSPAPAPAPAPVATAIPATEPLSMDLKMILESPLEDFEELEDWAVRLRLEGYTTTAIKQATGLSYEQIDELLVKWDLGNIEKYGLKYKPYYETVKIKPPFLSPMPAPVAAPPPIVAPPPPPVTVIPSVSTPVTTPTAVPLPSGDEGEVVKVILKLREEGKTADQIAGVLGWDSVGYDNPAWEVKKIILKYRPDLGDWEALKKIAKAETPTVLPKVVWKPKVEAPPPIAGPVEAVLEPGLDFEFEEITADGGATHAQKESFGARVKRFTKNAHLTEAEAAALRDYKGSGYAAVNDHLRGKGKRPPNFHIVEQIDKTFRASVKKDTYFWRGGWRAKEVGDLFQDNGFISCSVSKQISKGFDTKDCLWHIKVPKGTPISFPFGSSAGELEVILRRGSKFRVTSVSKEGHRTIVEAVMEG